MLTPGDLLVFMAYLAGLYRPIRKLSSITGRMSKATVSGERILDILDLQPDVRNLPDAIAAGPFLGSIEFSNVSFAYGRGTPVLHRVHFHIRAGEAVALMSESGSGKSTVASLLLRFYDPIGGSIIIDGLDTSKMTLESLRQQFAIVMQDSVLFDTSIRENIAYGRLDATEQEIVAAARAAGAHDFIMSLPEGYGTVAGERGALLSGGQRQRIAIARAFIRNASILILDEPLTGLDRDNEDTVRLALRRLMAGRTTLIITHDPATARMASEFLTIRDARVLELSRGPSRLEAAQ